MFLCHRACLRPAGACRAIMNINYSALADPMWSTYPWHHYSLEVARIRTEIHSGKLLLRTHR